MGPLAGKRILITRARAQAGALSDLLRREGAEPVEVPMIEIAPPTDTKPLDTAVASLDQYAWVVFTSANGVAAFCDRLSDAASRGKPHVAAISPGTAATLQERGIRVDLMPQDQVGEGVVAAFQAINLRGARVLLPVAEAARDVVARGLTGLGAHVDKVVAYRTFLPEGAPAALDKALRAGSLDAIAFTSPSTARNLALLLDSDFGALQGAAVASIGPVTTTAIKELGLRVDVGASEHTIPGLVAAVSGYFQKPAKVRSKSV